MASSSLAPGILAQLRKGVVIPAHPLALTAGRKLDERRQRALTRYYLSAGAGGIAVGVHTTQFAIREKGLLRPVLALAAEEDRRFEQLTIKVAGICGPTKQAVAEASLARELGYDIGLLSLAALREASVDQLIDHARAVGEVTPLFGFYLQPAVGGRVLPYAFWRRFAEIPAVVAIKMAPFNRYQTIDVVRAVAESGRAGEISLYTGNDDTIVSDLLTEYPFGGLRIVGGLLGHWSVWTRKAVELLNHVHSLGPLPTPGPVPASRLPDATARGYQGEVERVSGTADGAALRVLLTRAVEITDSNAAFFDAANGFHGCIAGLHEVLRRQGLLEGTWCLDPKEGLSPGQAEEIDRVYRAYPHLNDDAFVAAHRDEWLKG